jgi:hypothetical protein
MRQDADSQGTGRETYSVNDDTFSVVSCPVNLSRYAVIRPPGSLCNLITPPDGGYRADSFAIEMHGEVKIAMAATAIRLF